MAIINYIVIPYHLYHLFSGTPEVGGLTPIQALEIVRGLRGLNIVGGDVVEVCACASMCVYVFLCVQ